jgi:hypothetical protein
MGFYFMFKNTITQNKYKIKRVRISILWIILAAFAVHGCKTPQNDSTLIAEYNGEKLYLPQLERHVPRDLSGNDSIDFANGYVDEWLTDKAMAARAYKDISNLDQIIEPEVNAYKTQIISKVFSEWLTKKNLDTVVTIAEMQDYYKKNEQKYTSPTNYYQYLYVKTPNANASQVVSWMTANRPEELAKLTKWCMEGNAVEYRTDSSVVTEGELQRIQTGYGNLARAKQNIVHTFTTKEGGKTFTHYFKMLQVIEVGDQIPFAGAKDKIEMAILTVRRNDLVNQTKKMLLEEAKNSSSFKKNIP